MVHLYRAFTMNGMELAGLEVALGELVNEW